MTIRLLIATLVLGGALALSGCGGDGSATSAVKLELTPEQAAAIKKQDEVIANDEGGPQKVTRPGTRAR
jgi:hypothetical protein